MISIAYTIFHSGDALPCPLCRHSVDILSVFLFCFFFMPLGHSGADREVAGGADRPGRVAIRRGSKKGNKNGDDEGASDISRLGAAKLQSAPGADSARCATAWLGTSWESCSILHDLVTAAEQPHTVSAESIRDVVCPLLRRSSSLSYAVDWSQQHCLHQSIDHLGWGHLVSWQLIV